jgi:hypothetical protein
MERVARTRLKSGKGHDESHEFSFARCFVVKPASSNERRAHKAAHRIAEQKFPLDIVEAQNGE